jgi:hypothetical protein
VAAARARARRAIGSHRSRAASPARRARSADGAAAKRAAASRQARTGRPGEHGPRPVWLRCPKRDGSPHPDSSLRQGSPVARRPALAREREVPCSGRSPAAVRLHSSAPPRADRGGRRGSNDRESGREWRDTCGQAERPARRPWTRDPMTRPRAGPIRVPPAQVRGPRTRRARHRGAAQSSPGARTRPPERGSQ